jgi:hypothetical protein
MTIFTKTAGITGILALTLAGAAIAGEAHGPAPLAEGHAVMTDLGANSSATTYWVNAPEGWHVVTTVNTVSAESNAVVRFASVLQAGQSETISVPVPAGKPRIALRIHRNAEGVIVERTSDLID